LKDPALLRKTIFYLFAEVNRGRMNM